MSYKTFRMPKEKHKKLIQIFASYTQKLVKAIKMFKDEIQLLQYISE